jgi:hypothetical protein
VRSALCMWRRGAHISWLSLKTKVGGLSGEGFLRFGLKTGGDDFLQFDLKTSGGGFFRFGPKIRGGFLG